MTLRDLREKRNLSQAEVATRAAFDQTTVSQLELGKIHDPRHSTITKLASVYGVRIQTVSQALAATIREAQAA